MSFLRSLPPPGPIRDAAILAALPRLHAEWVTVTMGPVTLTVSADYLKIDNERVQMNAYVAQAAVESVGAILPTPDIVDAIERQAHLVPMPTRPPHGEDQMSSAWFAWCEEATNARVGGLGGLLAGHRKDIVIKAGMRPGRVYIFGGRWERTLERIETVAHGAHEAAYSDYSSGTRAIKDACLLRGQPASVKAILQSPEAALLGGPVSMLAYPRRDAVGTVSPITSASAWKLPAQGASLRRLHYGPQVRELQTALNAAGFELTVDGLFGDDTEDAVRAFQRAHSLKPDGVVGPKTRAALAGEGDTDPSLPAFDPSVIPLPLGVSDIVATFGSFEWEPAPTNDNPEAIRIFGTWARDNITTIEIPSLAGKGYAGPRGKVTCNRLAAPTIREFFEAVDRAGLSHLVLTFDGCWVPRLVRGGSILSNHSFGVDFDINARWNARGTMGAKRGERGSIVELLPIAYACKMGWGGNWRGGIQPDPMHFSVRIPRSA